MIAPKNNLLQFLEEYLTKKIESIVWLYKLQHGSQKKIF